MYIEATYLWSFNTHDKDHIFINHHYQNYSSYALSGCPSFLSKSNKWLFASTSSVASRVVLRCPTTPFQERSYGERAKRRGNRELKLKNTAFLVSFDADGSQRCHGQTCPCQHRSLRGGIVARPRGQCRCRGGGRCGDRSPRVGARARRAVEVRSLSRMRPRWVMVALRARWPR